MSVPVRIRETVSEAIVEAVEDVTVSPTDNSGKWIVQPRYSSILTKLILRPRDARLNFLGYSQLELPRTPPQHSEEVFDPDIESTGTYNVDLHSHLEGNYVLHVDFGKAASWLGAQTAVLFMTFSIDPKESIATDADWKLDVDVSSLFQWSAIVFSKVIGRHSGIPTAWIIKHVGLLLPNPGVMTVGFKIFGTRGPGDRVFDFSVDYSANLSTLRASGELVGAPVVGSSDSDSDWELL